MCVSCKYLYLCSSGPKHYIKIKQFIIRCSSKMKLVLFLCAVTAVEVFGFQQTDYKVVHERMSVDWFNTSYFKNLTVTLFYYTRYQKRFNGSVYVLQDLGYDLTDTVQAYKYQSNEYRQFPVFYEGSTCDTWKNDVFGSSPVHFNSNLTKCPLKKGFYYTSNLYVDDTKLPPFAPRGRYMLEFVTYKSKTIVLIRGKWYGEIKPTDPLEKVIAG